MQRRTKIIAASSLAAVLLIGALAAAVGPVGASAHGRWASHAAWGGGMRHGMASRICSDQRDERLESGIRLVEGFVAFTPDQTEAWETLTAALQAGSVKIGQACAAAEAEGPPEAAPQYLARAELVLTTGLGVLKDVRPSFDSLYAKLSDEQRALVDDFLAKRGHRRH